MLEKSDRLASLGKYKLIASLAEGGMAKVYLGLMAGPAGVNKLLVIKVLKQAEDAATPDDDVQLFWDEARLAARVIHPNIVHTYEVGEADGRYFLAMEYLDGQSYRMFQTRLTQMKLTVSLSEELRVISEVARGLHYAHELTDFKGEPLHVVHRDVSPQNIFITYEGQVKLLDFGIAKSQDHGHKTKVGIIKGKLDYIAPEQLSGDDVDARADIFALGVLLWEAATRGRFAGGRGVPEVKKIHARLTAAEPKIRDVKPDVPEALACIVDRAIAVDPEQRYQSAGALADAIDAFIESTGDRPSTKKLSEMMNKLFSDDRRKMHQLIDQQVEAMRDRPGEELTHSLPQISLNSTMTPTALREDLADVEPSSMRNLPPQADSGRMNTTAILAGTAAGLVMLAGWLVANSDGDPQAAAAAPVTQVQEARAPASDPQPDGPRPGPTVLAKAESVTVRVTVAQPDARAHLDGTEIPLPFTGTFQKGADLHRLEVTAKGYQADKRFIDFTQDRSLEIVLEEADARPGRRVRSSAYEREVEEVSEPEPAPTPAVAPAKRMAPGEDLDLSKKPSVPRDIDTDNPYAKPR